MLTGMRLVIAVAAAVLLLSTPAQASFELASAGDHARVAVDGAGTGHVVWNHFESGRDTTHYCRILRGTTGCLAGSERTFLPPASDPSNDYEQGGPWVFVSSGGAILVISHRCCGGYNIPPYNEVTFAYVSSDGGDTFAIPEAIGTGEPSGQAVIGPGDAIYTASNIITSGQHFQRQPVAGPFANTEAILSGTAPNDGTVAFLGDGRPIVAFNDDTTTFFRIFSGSGSQNNAANWAATQTVGPGVLGRLASGPSGVFLLYDEPARLIVRKLVGGAFDAPVEVASGFHADPQLFQDPSGRLHAVYPGAPGGSSGGLDLRYRTSADGVSWGPELQLASNDEAGFRTQVAAAADGRGFAVWDGRGIRATALESAVPVPTSGGGSGTPPSSATPGLPVGPGTGGTSGGGGGGGPGGSGTTRRPGSRTTITVGGLEVSLVLPASCVPAGQPIQLRVTARQKKAAARRSRLGRVRLRRVRFTLDRLRFTDRRPAFKASFPSRGMPSGSRHTANAQLTLRQLRRGGRTVRRTLSGEVAVC
jgi:hypothetical protein